MTERLNMSLSGLLRHAIGDRLAPDAETLLAMCADDIVFEFPFVPTTGVRRIEGKAALAAYLPRVGRLIRFDDGKVTAIYRTADPDVAILEFEVTGSGVATGAPYNQRYISRVRTRAGRIVHDLDDWNPLILLQAVGGEGALAAALAGDGR